MNGNICEHILMEAGVIAIIKTVCNFFYMYE